MKKILAAPTALVATLAVALALGIGVSAPLTERAAAAEQTVTVAPNPWYASESFDGWGTSLAWFADIVGRYPAPIRDDLYEKLFTESGLDLTVARYNIGGGNASDVADYLRPGGAIQGWWRPDADGSAGVYGGTATTLANKDAVLSAFDADDDADYDFDADQGQRWWLQKLAADDQITHWEAFSNSAPYFMTGSGYVSGRTDASITQLAPAAEDKFVAYLKKVTEHVEDAYGISFDTLEPLNEPYDCDGCWATRLVDGKPVARQEGMTVGPAQQATVIKKLRAELSEPGTTTRAAVAAPDEVNPTRFLMDWAGYDQAAKAALGQVNVHAYGIEQSIKVRDIAKALDRPLMMSEVEGSFGGGYDPANMANGLYVADRINDNVRELEPNSWVLWQPVEDEFNMAATGENLNWGSIFVDFDCRYYTEGGQQVFKSARRVAAAGGDSTKAPACGITTGAKFNVLRNYTTFIKPGARFVAVDDADSTAAVGPDGAGLSVVYTNSSDSARDISVDLSGFGQIADGATARSYVTTQSPAADPSANALVPGAAVPVDRAARKVVVSVPAKSVSTIQVSGVSGVAAQAAAVVGGHAYQIVGQASGKALTAAANGSNAVTISGSATAAAAAASQSWSLHPVPAANQENNRRYVVRQGAKVLGATASGTTLTTSTVEAAAGDPAKVWVLNTTDGKNYSLVNAASVQALDVQGGSGADGAGVGLWPSSGAANQGWTFRDLTITGVQPVDQATLVGVVPVLPTTVTPLYGWGAGAPAAVTWNMPSTDAWAAAGRVTVTGTATDVFGSTATVTATVDVGDFTVTDPTSVTVPAGTSLGAVRAQAPTTVGARIGASTAIHPTAVTWDWGSLSDASFAGPGVVTVQGRATSNNSSAQPLPATLSVIVVGLGSTANIAPLTSTAAAATFTESPTYSVDNTRNGVTTDKGWSNWRPDGRNASDTLSYTFDEARTLQSAKIFFYKDGSFTSWAQSMQVQYVDESGSWRNVPGYETAQPVTSPPDGSAPQVGLPLGLRAKGLRFVLNAYADMHLIVSEVQIEAAAAAPASVADLAALRVDGESVAGFDPAVRSYDSPLSAAALEHGNFPVVTAVPIDRDATVTVVQPTLASPQATVTVVGHSGSPTTTYAVTFVPAQNEVVSLAVTTLPLKTVYTVRDSFDATGMVVTATYSDETLADVSAAVRVSGFSSSKPGRKTLTASYTEAGKTVTTTFTVRVIEGTTFVLLEAPVLSGNPTVDATLRVTKGTWSPSGTRTVQWLRDGVAIPNATAWTYQPGGADYEKQISAEVTVSKNTYTPLTYTTEGVEIMIGGRLKLPAGLLVTGSPTAGSTLRTTVVAGDFRPAAESVSYQWYLDGVAVSGATGPSYVVPANSRRKIIRLEVTGTRHGYTTSTYVSRNLRIG